MTPTQKFIQDGLERAAHSSLGYWSCVAQVSPEMAQEILNATWTKNRKLTMTLALTYAKEMLEKLWTISDSAICIGTDGQLKNGQHRCNASIESGVPFVAVFLFGVTERDAMNFDHGHTRTPGNVLSMSEFVNAHQLGSTVSAFLRWGTYPALRWQSNAVSRIALVEYATEHLAELENAIRITHNVRTNTGANQTAASLAWLLFSRSTSPSLATEFMTALSTGEMLQYTSPILALRRRFEHSGKGSNRKLEMWEQLFLLIKAWNYWRKGRSARTLTWAQEEGIPEVSA